MGASSALVVMSSRFNSVQVSCVYGYSVSVFLILLQHILSCTIEAKKVIERYDIQQTEGSSGHERSGAKQ